MLGFWSVMRRKGPVFTGLEDDKGYQPPVSFKFPNWLMKALKYSTLAPVMQPEYKDKGKQTVFSGPEGIGTQPRPSFYFGEGKKAAEQRTPPVPPTRGVPTHPGYLLDREHAFSY